jgi:hypothetical protein
MFQALLCLYCGEPALTCGFSVLCDLRSRESLTIRQIRADMDDWSGLMIGYCGRSGAGHVPVRHVDRVDHQRFATPGAV